MMTFQKQIFQCYEYVGVSRKLRAKLLHFLQQSEQRIFRFCLVFKKTVKEYCSYDAEYLVLIVTKVNEKKKYPRL